jgi:hypothetical protein
MVRLASILFMPSTSVAAADYRVTRDHGGFVEDYKTRYAKIRDSGERVIIDSVCNSACTLVLAIVFFYVAYWRTLELPP